MWTITFHCVYPAYCETLHIATTTQAITVTSHGRRGVSNHQPLDCLSDSLFSSHQMKHQRSASMARWVRGIHCNRSHAMTLPWVHFTYTITHSTSGVTDVKSDKILPRVFAEFYLNVLSQWETALQCNVVFHLLSPCCGCMKLPVLSGIVESIYSYSITMTS